MRRATFSGPSRLAVPQITLSKTSEKPYRWSMSRRRAISVPDWVTQAIPPAPGERKPMTALAAAELKDGRWTVATATTLLVVSLDGAEVDFDWDAVDNATWDNEADTITVIFVDGGGRCGRHWAQVPKPGSAPATGEGDRRR